MKTTYEAKFNGETLDTRTSKRPVKYAGVVTGYTEAKRHEVADRLLSEAEYMDQNYRKSKGGTWTEESVDASIARSQRIAPLVQANKANHNGVHFPFVLSWTGSDSGVSRIRNECQRFGLIVEIVEVVEA